LLSYAPAPVLLGSTTPRIFTPPLVTGRPGPCGCGCALTPATSLGFSALEFFKDPLGIDPLPWQRWLMIHAHELRPDGRFRFRTVVVLVARQNGKTTIVEGKNLWKMFVLQVRLVIGTAQNLDLSEESWDHAVDIVESIPELKAEIAKVDKTNGKKALKLTNGSRWKIAAASRRGGRGLSGDDVNLDELREHQNWDSWGAVTKTTMARPNPQIWAFSNAGDDKSIVLNALLEQGRAAAEHPETADQTLGLFEWSAPDDVKCTCGRPDNIHTPTCRLRDPVVRAQANPALGYTMAVEALDSALTTDPDAVYRTECLCQRVPDLRPDWVVIDKDTWLSLADPTSRRVGRVVFAIDATPGGTHAVVGVAGVREDGLGHLEVVDHRRGTGWVVDRAVALKERHGAPFVVDPKGPAGFLIADLEEAGVEVIRTSAGDVADATGSLIAGTGAAEGDDATFRYIPNPALDAAVAGAVTKPLGDGQKWDRRSPSVDISPLVAITLARHGLATYVEEESMEPWAVYL
jgi:hypothetical protein